MPHRSKWPLAVSLCARTHPTESDFFELAQAGIKTVERGYAYPLYPDIEWENIQLLSRRYGVSLWSRHLPFD